MQKLISSKIKLKTAVIDLFNRIPNADERHLGGNYKKQIELDIHRTNSKDRGDCGFFLNSTRIDLSCVEPTVKWEPNLSFEATKDYFNKQFRNSNINEKDAEKFSLMMTHLCNQGFINSTGASLYTKDYAALLYENGIFAKLNDRKISLITEDNSVKYLNYEWRIELRSIDDENIISSRTLSYKFFPDNTMEISMDNPNDVYQELFEEFFIKLNSIDKKQDILGKCQDENDNIISNLLSSDIGLHQKQETFKTQLKTEYINDVLEHSKNQLVQDLPRTDWSININGVETINRAKDESEAEKDSNTRLNEISDKLSKNGIESCSYLSKVMLCLSSQDCGNNIFRFFLNQKRHYKIKANNPTISQPHNITLHINEKNNEAHVDFSLTLQKYDEKGQTNSDNDITLNWSFNHKGNVKLEMSGKISDDYYKLYTYLHTTARYDSKNTGDALLRQDNPIALKNLQAAKLINRLLKSNYHLTTFVRLIDKDISKGTLDFSTHKLSDDIYNLLGKDTQEKLLTIAKELQKRHDSNKTTIGSIGLKIKDFINYIINSILNYFGRGVKKETFEQFTSKVFPHTDLDQKNKYTNSFVKRIQEQEEKRQQSTDAQKIKID